jgi:hypothetical protein
MDAKSDVIKQNIIRLNGINRSQSDNLSADGDMEEIIGLRKKNGSYEVIGDYPVKLKYDDGTPVDLSEFKKLFLHKTTEYTNYIGIKEEGNNVYFIYLNYNDNFNETEIYRIENTVITDLEYNISQLNNFITIKYLIEKTTYRKAILHFSRENSMYQILHLDNSVDVEVLMTVTDNSAQPFDLKELYQTQVLSWENRRGLLLQMLVSSINEQQNKMLKDGCPTGYFFWNAAIRFYDGSYVKVTPDILFSITFEDVSINQNPQESILIEYSRFLHPYVYCGFIYNWDYAGDMRIRLYSQFPKFEIKFKLKTNMEESVKRLISSIDIFISRQVNPLITDESEINKRFDNISNTGDSYYSGMSTMIGVLYKTKEDICKEILSIKDLAVYYKVISFREDEITNDNEKKLTANLFPENLVTENEILETKEPDDFFSRGNYNYNYKEHEYNIIKSERKIESFYAINLPKPMLITTQDPVIDGRKFNDMFARQIISYSEIYIKQYDKYGELHIVNTIKIDGYNIKINPYINPYNSNIDFIKVYLKTKSGYFYRLKSDEKIYVSARASYSNPSEGFNLNPVDFETIIGNNNLPELSEAYNTENLENRLYVSSLNNPFIFNTSSVYTIGTGKILALYSNTKAISQGQFGEYPLIALCSDGRWALGLGSGEVDYSSIKPLSRDVYKKGENNEPMAQLDDAVVFATERGLLISSGEEVLELSQIIEGELFRFTEPGFDHIDLAKQAITNDLLVQLLPSVSKIPFKEYLNGSNIGYIYGENREIVIANPNYDYCYIYSLSSGMWYKNNIRIKYFLNNYPYLYAVSDNKLIDLTDEQPTAGKDTFFLTKPVKLEGISFKEAYRAVLRSHIRPSGTTYCGFYVFGSEDGQLWRFLGGTEFDGKIPLTGGTADFRDIGCTTERTDVKYLRMAFAGKIKSGSKLDFIELSARFKNTLKIV